MICPKCNKEINDISKYCRFCGASVIEKTADSEPKQDQTSDSEIKQDAVTETEQAEVSADKSHQEKPKNIKIIIIAVAAVLVAAALICAAVFIIKSKKSSDDKAETAGETVLTTAEDTTESNDLESEETTEVQESSEGKIIRVVNTESDNLRMHSSSDIDSEVIASVPKGTKVNLLSEENGFSLIEYNGKKGWVSSDFLVTEEEYSESSAAETSAKSSGSNKTGNSTLISDEDVSKAVDFGVDVAGEVIRRAF